MSRGLTVILSRARAGDERARYELISLIYDELRGVASGLMRRERAGHTLSPTAVSSSAQWRVPSRHVCRRGAAWGPSGTRQEVALLEQMREKTNPE